MMSKTASRLAIFVVWLATTVCLARADEAVKQELQSGPVKTTIQLAPTNPVIGDAVTLTITVTAEESVEVLMPAFGEALERYAIVDFVPRERIDDQGRTVYTQTYRLTPPSSGPQAIPPILIEYVDRRPGQREAPEGLDAYEILTERLEFEVASVIADNAAANLKPPLGELEKRQPPPPPRWPWIALGATAAVIAGAVGWRSLVIWRRRARRRSAYDIARSRLDSLLARPRPELDGIDGFYVELSSIVRQYLEDRFELRAPELTTEEFLASLGKSPDLSAEHQGLLREFLRGADLVKFAQARPSSEDVERSIESARRFLDETQDNAPLLEPNQSSALGSS